MGLRVIIMLAVFLEFAVPILLVGYTMALTASVILAIAAIATKKRPGAAAWTTACLVAAAEGISAGFGPSRGSHLVYILPAVLTLSVGGLVASWVMAKVIVVSAKAVARRYASRVHAESRGSKISR